MDHAFTSQRGLGRCDLPLFRHFVIHLCFTVICLCFAPATGFHLVSSWSHGERRLSPFESGCRA